MIKISEYKAETYMVTADGFLIDIEKGNDFYGIWLYHKKNDTKEFVLGIGTSSSYKKVLHIVEDRLKDGYYIRWYKDKHMSNFDYEMEEDDDD